MLATLAGLFAGLMLSLNPQQPTPVNYDKVSAAGLDYALLEEAIAARDAYRGKISNERYVTIIDYRKNSSEDRLYLVDTKTGDIETMLVAHGRGSDTNHDGFAETFSDTPESKMTSIGSFVTAETYYGKHGLSLRLDGLEETNSNARARAIVIHGADYINPARTRQGRSWGCPSVERARSKPLIEAIKGGSFVYTTGGTISA
ncbi:murein L,D-transpeptidase catalytic domain family protein [Parvularcula flava]|uniref:Murein L,D-transpeptidase catalytic domain family protein n=1 Tax=Aquisalinus luteolus TaxID=1566827 RepID=A0A8J3A3M6_9PROT|nr:murein L,D-transpeptidase catalytic domain family protein [Aquisalinus luteolus]NHK28996.1 murein L,D-transpeptidase catalytic domain family protein [Aquisalinus luteolus]GGI00630.1 hypothetical protein GCM10011355_29380 [Aquisalinus luteolus]